VRFGSVGAYAKVEFEIFVDFGMGFELLLGFEFEFIEREFESRSFEGGTGANFN
jgi:hypothetical protein